MKGAEAKDTDKNKKGVAEAIRMRDSFHYQEPVAKNIS